MSRLAYPVQNIGGPNVKSGDTERPVSEFSSLARQREENQKNQNNLGSPKSSPASSPKSSSLSSLSLSVSLSVSVSYSSV